MRNEADKN